MYLLALLSKGLLLRTTKRLPPIAMEEPKSYIKHNEDICGNEKQSAKNASQNGEIQLFDRGETILVPTPTSDPKG